MVFGYDEFAAKAPQWYKAIATALHNDNLQEGKKLAEEQFGKKRDLASVLAMVNVYLTSGDAYNAKPLVEEAMELAKGVEKAAALHAQGKLLAMEKDYDEASKSFSQAAEIYKGAQNKTGQASVLNSKALLIKPTLLDFEVEPFMDIANEALTMFKDAKDTQGTASVLDTIVQLKLQEGKVSHALNVAQEMAKVYIQAKDPLGEANAVMRMAEIYKLDDQLQEALNKTQEAYQMYVTAGDQRKKTTAINKMAHILAMAGSFNDAHKAANASLSLCRELRDKRGQAATMCLMGTICDSEREYSKAAYKLEKAAAIYKQLEDKKEEALTLDSIAQMQLKAFWAVDDAAEPASNCEKALKLLAEVGQDDGVLAGYVLNTMAFALLACKRKEEAFDKAKDALIIFQEAEDAGGEAFTLTTLAQLHFESKEKKEAIEMVNKALRVAQDANNAAEAAWAQSLLGEYGGAKKKGDDVFKFTDDSGVTTKTSQIYMWSWGMQDYFLCDGFVMRGVVEKKKADKASSSSSAFIVDDAGEGGAKASRVSHSLDFSALGTA